MTPNPYLKKRIFLMLRYLKNFNYLYTLLKLGRDVVIMPPPERYPFRQRRD